MANYTFSNTSVITINDATANGPTAASLYPAAISVSGTTGVITGIQVKINGLNHQYADDIDILLVGPNGQKVLLMSDAGGDFSLTNINLTFSDSATSLLADNTQITSSGTYKPTDYQSGDSFPSSAPSGPYGTSLSAFNNATANGTWQLFVVDDLGGGTGTISSGWSLDITTAQPQPVQFNVSSLFNADGIVNRSNGVTDSSQNALDGSTTLITQSYATSAGGSNGNGLPDNGFFAANAYHPDIQLNYTNSNDGNNVRLLNSSNPSFTISVPQTKYSEVHLFAFSTNEYNNANSINVKLNYTDGSFTQVNTNVPDWFYNINETPDLYYLIDGLDRANFYSGSPSFENTDSAAVFGLRFTSDSTKTLQSIQVTQTSTSQANLVFLGSTGVPVSSYTPPSNTPPSLANPIPDTAATEDTPFSFTVTSNAFTDADGNTLTYSATQSNGSALPSWLTFNSTTRTFSGTPTNSDVATISVRVTASDGQATATDDFNITVNNVNDAPTATNLSTAETYTEDTLLNFTDIVVTDVDSANIIATLTLSNPAAGSFNIATSGTVTSTYNAATGVWTASGATANVNALLAGLTFTPAANFNSNFTIATSISDGVAPAITGTKTITGVPVNDPVTGSPTATLAAGTEDTAYTITAASLLQGFADADGNTLSVTGLTATNGAVVNNNNGTYTFTPNANYNGTVTFTYSVTDGNGSTLSGQTRSFALSAVNDAPVLTVPASQTVNEDTNFTLTGISIADVDALSSPLQVTLSANNGKLTFGNTTGLTFTSGGNNSNTMTFTGSLTDITNALNNLVYRSNLNYSGADTITLAVNDQGNTGTGEPLSDTKTIAVQVNVVNQTLSATTATDTINIGSGNDTINATFEQLQQNDQINVGLGIDTLILQGGISSNTITINLNNATNQVQNITGTTLLNFEKFDFSSFAGITQFTGGTGNDYIKAGLGNDSLVGGSGDDYLNGGAGNDTLNGGTGNDTMLGGVGNDSYTVDNIGDVVTENGNEGTDIVSASINYTLTDNLENLTLTGTAIAGTGNSLDNIITGNSANNILNGGAGNDTLNGSTGNDTMLGGAGNDSYSVDNIGDVVTENANEGIDIVSATINYTLTDNLENLTLTGTAITGTGNALDNTITGNAGNNILNAGDGNDTLNGGVGTDIMSGGAGNDLYYVDNTGDVVTENANEGTDTVSASITYTLTGNVENLTLTGTTVIDGTGNSLDNIITGNGGKNILNAGDGNDTLNGGAGADTMLGGTGNDSYIVDIIGDVVTENANEGTDTVSASITYTLTDNVENLILTGTTVINGTGNSLDNSLTGNTANNTLDGGVGADTMSGGAGNDTYIVDNIGDVISENANEGTDTVSAAIDYTLSANVENLTLTGSAIAGTGNTLNNTITGNAGDNIIDGGAGNDSMSGGAGNDTYIVDSTGDVITEAASAGTDTVAASINYTLAANLENLILTGTAVSGTGNTVNNSITGNSADNIINGGTGADTMLGGAGNDLYYVEIAGDVISENANEGTDTVSASITYTLTDNVENLILTGTTAINGTGNSLANSLTGNTANNTLDGGVGADTMSGGAGNDTYIVDNIGDVISENANEGTDTVSAAISYTLSANVRI
ncbi:hypothetical protein NIES2100_57400 [Calothrix sp. NIES-2100]|uniref:beta strand repeat-containing protein n=1 Tax=Calothrix sp. NIES-2100 TaxID=1954172 RepID=UPI000B5F60C9|nr:hypothetical protein NIES2100_57400 [Calothrix sp. NIES-2100]